MRLLSFILVLIMGAGCAATEQATGPIKSTYALNPTTSLAAGNIQVKANDVFLKEGQDFKVNYEHGTVSITNSSFLKPGVLIEILY